MTADQEESLWISEEKEAELEFNLNKQGIRI